jgi:hypothetical protein
VDTLHCQTKAQLFWFRQYQTQSETGVIAAKRVGFSREHALLREQLVSAHAPRSPSADFGSFVVEAARPCERRRANTHA